MFSRNKTSKLIQSQLPLTLVCLDGLGSLAEKQPILASTAISCLRDFLVNPADILSHLHTVRVDAQKPGVFVCVTNTEGEETGGPGQSERKSNVPQVRYSQESQILSVEIFS